MSFEDIPEDRCPICDSRQCVADHPTEFKTILEMSGKTLIGTCGDCDRYGKCEVQDRIMSLDGWQPFGCIHWKEKS